MTVLIPVNPATTNHEFDSRLPVPYNKTRDTRRVTDERQNCDREPGAGQLDFYHDVCPRLPVVRGTDCRNECTGVRLSIGHPEKFYQEWPKVATI